MKRRGPAAGGESGFALLLVFLMAACIAISLYMELPRVAFESQRAKEQLLIERGEQYKRGIQVFVRKNNRYPATLDELESYNNRRYLRRRYPDPMTGKEKWRLIKVGPGGVLLDSINTKQKQGQNPGEEKKEAQTFIGEAPALGGNPQDGQQQGNLAVRRRRPSDSPGMGGQTLGPDGNPVDVSAAGMAGIAPMPNVPGQTAYPGQTGYPGQTPVPGQTVYPGQTAYPGQTIPGQAIPGQTVPGQTIPGQGIPGQVMVPGQAGYPGQMAYPGGQVNPAGQPFQVTQPNAGQGYPMGQQVPGQVYPGAQPYPGQIPGLPTAYPGAQNPQAGSSYPYPAQPGVRPAMPGFPGGQTGMTPGVPGQAQNQAVQLIQNILTSPRPGGMPTSGFPGGTQIGGGIAGVASTDEEESIIVYDDHQKYNQWEFIYDISKDRGLAGGRPGGGTIGTPASQMGQMPGQPPGQTGFGQSGLGQSGFGQSGFGQSGFGQSGFGQSGAGQPPQGFGTPGFGQTPQLPPTQIPPQR